MPEAVENSQWLDKETHEDNMNKNQQKQQKINRLIGALDILEFTDTDTNFKITIPYHDQGVNRQNWSFQKRMRNIYIYIFFLKKQM